MARNRKRTTLATIARRDSAIVRAINTTAGQRLTARMDTEPHPNTVYRLTRELDELFDARRDETAGTFTDPYQGHTWKART